MDGTNWSSTSALCRSPVTTSMCASAIVHRESWSIAARLVGSDELQNARLAPDVRFGEEEPRTARGAPERALGTLFIVPRTTGRVRQPGV